MQVLQQPIKFYVAIKLFIKSYHVVYHVELVLLMNHKHMSDSSVIWAFVIY